MSLEQILTSIRLTEASIKSAQENLKILKELAEKMIVKERNLSKPHIWDIGFSKESDFCSGILEHLLDYIQTTYEGSADQTASDFQLKEIREKAQEGDLLHFNDEIVFYVYKKKFLTGYSEIQVEQIETTRNDNWILPEEAIVYLRQNKIELWSEIKTIWSEKIIGIRLGDELYHFLGNPTNDRTALIFRNADW